ncbi:MAG: hypothetical protein ACJA2M_000404 [Polaribacter sp.]|jgi:hypothetical protein
MKNYIYSSIVLFFIGINVFGQSPNWSVNENDFEYTMSFVAFVNIDGVNLSSSNDKLAAFSNGELRGVTNLIYVQSKDRYYAYLVVFSNTGNETISFKAYDAANDKIVDIDKTIDFEINAHHGNLFQSFSLANPALNDQVEILSFEFKDVVISSQTISGKEMVLNVYDGLNLENLTIVFELSIGAKLFSEGVLLESGNNTLDFSNPIELQILSEDESKLETWVISVVYDAPTGDLVFYKKNAVCYQGGVIKVVASESVTGTTVSLFKDQTIHTIQTLTNGEVIFNNLEVGDYTVKVTNIEKAITINLKE